uniref:Uncharacterized protein n=1 Tax=Arundo donax TaxID=35708 RepID=A0A0A9GSH0_ARUDO
MKCSSQSMQCLLYAFMTSPMGMLQQHRNMSRRSWYEYTSSHCDKTINNGPLRRLLSCFDVPMQFLNIRMRF